MNRPLLQLTELCLVWGPLELPDDAVSFDDDWDSVIYTQAEIAEAILCVPNTILVHDGSPNWSAWRAEWKRDTHRLILINVGNGFWDQTMEGVQVSPDCWAVRALSPTAR